MSNSYGGHDLGTFGTSRFDQASTFGQGNYSTPGWKRAQQRKDANESPRASQRFIEGELTASSAKPSEFVTGDRVFHQKFGYGEITNVEGNKLTIDFEKAGEKRVIDSFVEKG